MWPFQGATRRKAAAGADPALLRESIIPALSLVGERRPLPSAPQPCQQPRMSAERSMGPRRGAAGRQLLLAVLAAAAAGAVAASSGPAKVRVCCPTHTRMHSHHLIPYSCTAMSASLQSLPQNTHQATTCVRAPELAAGAAAAGWGRRPAWGCAPDRRQCSAGAALHEASASARA